MEILIGEYSNILFILIACVLAFPIVECFISGITFVSGNDGLERKTATGIVFIVLALLLTAVTIYALMQYSSFIQYFS